jgi:hypothetical protein
MHLALCKRLPAFLNELDLNQASLQRRSGFTGVITRLKGKHVGFQAAQHKPNQHFFFFINGFLAAVDEFCSLRTRNGDIETSV